MSEQKPISHLVSGAIVGGIMVIVSLVMDYFGMNETIEANVISLVIFMGGLILFISLYGKALDHKAGFGQLFAYGFKTSIVIALITIVFSVIYILIVPEYKEKMIEAARQQIAKDPDLTSSDIEEGVAMYKRMFWVSTIGPFLLIFAILGAIGSVIGAAVTKKNKINPVDQLTQ